MLSSDRGFLSSVFEMKYFGIDLSLSCGADEMIPLILLNPCLSHTVAQATLEHILCHPKLPSRSKRALDKMSGAPVLQASTLALYSLTQC